MVVVSFLMLLIRIPQFIIEWVLALFMSLVAILFCWFIALFVNKETGHLPFFLKWFETVDATCYDEMWVAEHPAWSKYKIALTWIARNPAYGFNYFLRARVNEFTPVKFFGNLLIADGEQGVQGWNLTISRSGVFMFEWIKNLNNGHCIRGEYGWNIKPLAKMNSSKMLGALMFCFIARFMDFKK